MPLLAEHALSGRSRELARLTMRILLAILGLIAAALAALPVVHRPC